MRNGQPTEKSGSTFKVRAADGTGTVEVPEGAWYINTKARCERMIVNFLSSEARQVYACLELHTMGFSQELAVTMENGKRRNLTMMDLRVKTGLSKQNLRRAIAELEDAGLAERRAIGAGPVDKNGSQRATTILHKGKIELYSWAVPRSAKQKNGSQRATTIPVWFPTSWEPLKSLITRKKLQISIDEVAARDYLLEGEEAARNYQQAEKVAARFLERVCAQPKTAAHKKRCERNGKELIERNGGDPPPLLDLLQGGKADEEDRYLVFKSLFPKDHFDEPKAKPSFEGMKASQQSAAIERLRVYLISERWRKSPQFIPLASNWLKSDFTADPPPYLPEPAKRQSKTASMLDEAFGKAVGE